MIRELNGGVMSGVMVVAVQAADFWMIYITRYHQLRNTAAM